MIVRYIRIHVYEYTERIALATFLIETESRKTSANSKQNMAEMASNSNSPNFPSLRLGRPAPQAWRRHHAQSLLGPSFHDPKNASCFRIPARASRHLSLATTMSDDTLSALTLPLHCTSILQPATPLQVVAFEPWTISAPICLNRFTFAELWKPDPWTCMCFSTISSSAFGFLIEMNFSFKSLFAIWSVFITTAIPLLL